MAKTNPTSQAAERRAAAAGRARASRERAAREMMIDRLVVDQMRVAFSETTPEVGRVAKRIWGRVYDHLVRNESFSHDEARAAVAQRVTSPIRDAAPVP